MDAPPPYRIRLASPDDLPLLTEHILEHILENGDGGIHFAPYDKASGRRRFSDPERIAEWREAMVRGLEEPAWRRVFLGFDGEGRTVAHVDLTGGSLPSDLHRCRLGMGLVAAHRRRGLGRALLVAAIDWARAAGLRWMDLGVFAGNEPAQALYRSLGFVEVGRVADRFRLEGLSITDISMVLDLRRATQAGHAE